MTETLRSAAVALVLLPFMLGCRPDNTAPPPAPVSRQIHDESRRAQLKSFWDTFRAAQADQAAGRNEAAIAGYRKALALDPAHEQSHVNVAPLLRKAGRVEEAAAVLASLVRHHGASARSHAVAGDLAIGLDPGRAVDFAGAIAHYQRTRDTNREESGPFVRLARAYLSCGRWSDAARELETVLARLDPGSQEAANLLAITHAAQGRVAAAQSVLTRVAEFHVKAGRAPKVSGDGDTLRPLSAHELASHRFADLRTVLESGPAGEPAPHLSHAGGRPVLRAARGSRGETLFVPLPGRGLAVLEAGDAVDRAPALGLAEVKDAWTVAFVDLDQDGLEDLYVAGGGWWADGEDSAWRARPDGSFAPLPLASLELAGSRSCALAVADLDGDGHGDLVLAQARSDRPGVRVRWSAARAGGSRVAEAALRGPVLDLVASAGGEGVTVLAAHFYSGAHRVHATGRALAAEAVPDLPGPRAGLVAMVRADLGDAGGPALVLGYLTDSPGSPGPGLLAFGRDRGAWRGIPLDVDLRHGVRGLATLEPGGTLVVLEGSVALDGAGGAAILERTGGRLALRRLRSSRTLRAWCAARWPGQPSRLLLGGAGPLAADRWPATVLDVRVAAGPLSQAR